MQDHRPPPPAPGRVAAVGCASSPQENHRVLRRTTMRTMLNSLRTRLGQLRQVFTATRRVDPKFLPLVLGIPFAVFAALMGIGWFSVGPLIALPLALITALLIFTLIFGRRAQKAQLAAIHGQPGAAAAVLQSLRGRWIVTPGVAYTRQQDFVHRVVGPPGVVLVGEGRRARTLQLLKQEQRTIVRALGTGVPIHLLTVGDGEGEVSLGKLRVHIMRLRKGLKARDIPPVNQRLGALSADLPIPKGPMPAGAKPPRPRRR